MQNRKRAIAVIVLSLLFLFLGTHPLSRGPWSYRGDPVPVAPTNVFLLAPTPTPYPTPDNTAATWFILHHVILPNLTHH